MIVMISFFLNYDKGIKDIYHILNSMEYRRSTLLCGDEEQPITPSSFSYYESIEEFNDYRYHETSYSYYNVWVHLLNLICCKRFHGRKRTDE